MEIFCGEIIRFGNFRRELIFIFAGRHLARNVFAETYFPLIIFAGSILPFSRGDTLRGDFLYFRGDSIFVKFLRGVAFRFRGETPCTMNFCGEIIPFGNFRGEFISVFAGRHFARRFFVFFAGSQFPFLQMDSYTIGYNENGVVHFFWLSLVHLAGIGNRCLDWH